MNNFVVFNSEVTYETLLRKCSGPIYTILGKDGERQLCLFAINDEDFKSVRHFIEDYLHIVDGEVYIKNTEDDTNKKQGALISINEEHSAKVMRSLWFITANKWFTIDDRKGH
jgi:hypothetical protein